MTFRKIAGCAVALLLSAQGSTHKSKAELSGVVFDSVGAVVPGAKLTFLRAPIGDAMLTVVSGNDGRYRVTLPADYYEIRVEKHFFCPNRRAVLYLPARATVQANLRIQPCGISDGFETTDTGEVREYSESSPRLNYESFNIPNSRSKHLKLLVSFAERYQEGKRITYSAVGAGDTKAPVSATYDLVSITADRILLNPDTGEVLAEGSVIVEDGRQTAEAHTAQVRFRKGVPVITYKSGR